MDGKGNPEIPIPSDEVSTCSGRLKFLRGPIGISGVSPSLTRYVADISYTGIWFMAEKPSAYRAWICVPEEKELEKLKEKIPATDILRSGKDFIYIRGEEMEPEQEELGGFGF